MPQGLPASETRLRFCCAHSACERRHRDNSRAMIKNVCLVLIIHRRDR
jgi:hypothetical protein